MSVEIHIEFWPSPSEIHTNNSRGSFYVAGLKGFEDSLDVLKDDLRENSIYLRENIRTDAALQPDIINTIIIFLNTSGLAIALYKILDLWVKKINGRKFKVKFKDIEIEATQLSQRRFMKLIENMRKYDEKHEEFYKGEINKEELKNFSIEIFKGYKKINERKSHIEEIKLGEIYWDTRNEISSYGEKIRDYIDKHPGPYNPRQLQDTLGLPDIVVDIMQNMSDIGQLRKIAKELYEKP